MKIKNLKLRQIFTTTNKKTVELEAETYNGICRTSVPMGTSRGKYEVPFLSVDEVARKFSRIKGHFIDKEFADQEDVDVLLRILDRSKDFSDIGGNLALAISSIFLKSFALEKGKEVFEFLSTGPRVPKPICNVVGGWKGFGTDIQEFLLLPTEQNSFLDSMNKISKIYEDVGEALKKQDQNFLFSKNIESAWVTKLGDIKILDILSNFTDEKLKIGLDVAASQLWNGEVYEYKNSNAKFTKSEHITFLEDLVRTYPIVYLEDPFHEDDITSFSVLTQRIKSVIVCGDDLYATNLKRLKDGIQLKATNAIIIKPNQVGTITDVISVIKEAKKNGIIPVMSHRSGETEDTLICHLAVGLGCDYIKLGTTGDRIVKINEMLRIEEKIKSSSV